MWWLPSVLAATVILFAWSWVLLLHMISGVLSCNKLSPLTNQSLTNIWDAVPNLARSYQRLTENITKNEKTI